MKIILYKNSKMIGSFIFNDNEPVIDNKEDEEMQDILNKVKEETIQARYEIKDDNDHHIFEKDVSVGDDYFPHAFISWLRREGYKVEVGDESVDDKITQKLEEVSDSDLKDKILNELPSMTYLEKTFLLETMKKES